MNSKYLDILKQYWGYDSFRGIQEEIITSIGEGHDTLGLMPTGGGKSICFQVPALAMDGVCIVITPLIALMKDQVEQLKLRSIRAEAIYAGMLRAEIIRVLDNTVLGGVKLLYVSPERLSTELFLAKLQRIPKVSMIVVDEAHCVSQWGYDFRPSYLKISELRRFIPYHVPVLALTATATPKVVEDIQNQLAFSEHNVIKMSYERKNLIYVVRKTRNRNDELLHIIQSIPHGSVIIYVRSRKATSELARFLNAEGITAINYHAGLTNAEKDYRQTNWTKNRVRVMVATNAFGMGIDKPDVRLVIHYSLPDSLEAYFQEAGRAGRDGMTSYAVLLYEDGDSRILRRRIVQTYPDPEYVKRTYEDMCCFLQVGVGEAEGRTFDFARGEFCTFFGHFAANADSALKLLTNAGYINYCEEQDFMSSLHILLVKEDLYKLWGQSSEADTLMQGILRAYTGVFADHVYIEETRLSHITGLSVEQIYALLKEWNRNRIIDYVPHRNTPTITFTMARIETERIVLPPSVYTDRKSDYETRIEKMLQYVESEDTCRSRLLLDYFGETDSSDCGRCDVCHQQRQKSGDNKIIDVVPAIRQLLADRQEHSIDEIARLPYQQPIIDSAIAQMVSEEEILVDGGVIRITD